MSLSVMIPAHNEADLIESCLNAVVMSYGLPQDLQREILVLANGCDDATAVLAEDFTKRAAARGWSLHVERIKEGGKLNALTRGDGLARGKVRIYLDADVWVSPGLIADLHQHLDGETARYASGTPVVSTAQSAITRAYARFWQRLPFFRDATPGFGIFAMNMAGRSRWESWPDIISDDTFARLNFTAAEREKLSGRYNWPMVEGFANLVRVRRRQNQGVHQISQRYPSLMQNDDKSKLSTSELVGLALRDPLGFVIYAAVSLTVKTPLFAGRTGWVRGR